MGSEGEWLQLAESKLKKDADLDYQSKLWELGTEVAEQAQVVRGGLNITHEEELLSKMDTWFKAGEGKLNYIKPSISRENGFQLLEVRHGPGHIHGVGDSLLLGLGSVCECAVIVSGVADDKLIDETEDTKVMLKAAHP
jgi:hypothetical protein